MKPAQAKAKHTAFDLTSLGEPIRKAPNDIASYRSVLEAGRAAIHEVFETGAPAHDLLSLQTELTDYVLITWWENSRVDCNQCALVAVGGYGRGELHPASDVDICVLIQDRAAAENDPSLGAWITSLWDLGLDIGHSVRTIDDCEQEAASDLTVITTLMESRHLCGDHALYEKMERVIAPTNLWPSDEFYEAKMAEQEERRKRYLTNAYLLEPNVKESTGGLRDIQMISWVFQRQFGTNDLRDLVKNELLTTEEFSLLWDGLELLWRVRYLLHHNTQRREDRLLFDHQRAVAVAFGFIDEGNNQCIEQLMQRYYRTVMQLQRLNDILLQGIGGVISGVTAASPVLPINERFQLRNGYLEVTHDEVFQQSPSALFEIFIVFGKTSGADTIRSNTIRLMRASLPLIDDAFRNNPEVHAQFLEIFASPIKLTRLIRMMNRYGVLAAYIPAFDEIVGRMQYDLFHVFTVDEHTTRVIRNTRRFALKEHDQELPHCSHVMTQVDKPALLYLIGLFHDIAKGRGGDHSELGAVDMQEFAITHALSDADVDLCTWVVRHHLLMSTTAQRKDITDPNVQLEFAREVGSSRRLHYLYLLTVADIRATNPELWNSFKQTLLQSLYTACSKILNRGLQQALDEADVINARQSHALALLDANGVNRGDIQMLWGTFRSDYFRQYQSIEIARQTETILAHDDTNRTMVSIRRSVSRGATEVLIFTPDSPTLFAMVTSALESLQLDVMSANLTTTQTGHALNVFYVLEADGSIINNKARFAEIREGIINRLADSHDLADIAVGHVPRQARHFDVVMEVQYDNDTAHDGTDIYLSAADRPGILSTIARIFTEHQLIITGARITTLGERIEDVFSVFTHDGKTLTDIDEQNQLATRLQEEL